MTYHCELIDRSAQLTLTIRRRVAVQDLPQVLGAAYGALGQYLGEMGVAPAGAPFVAYYNMDMQDLDIEIGFPVAGKLPGRGEIQAGEIPGGMAVTCLHTGPYNQVGGAYEAVTAFIQERSLQPGATAYEFYLNDPMQVPPQELLTEVILPLQTAPV